MSESKTIQPDVFECEGCGVPTHIEKLADGGFCPTCNECVCPDASWPLSMCDKPLALRNRKT